MSNDAVSLNIVNNVFKNLLNLSEVNITDFKEKFIDFLDKKDINNNTLIHNLVFFNKYIFLLEIYNYYIKNKSITAFQELCNQKIKQIKILY
jgi:hypothetical protein